MCESWPLLLLNHEDRVGARFRHIDGALGGEQLPGAVHAPQTNEEVVRRLSERDAKQTMTVLLRETRLPRRRIEQHSPPVLASERIATTTKPREAVVMNQIGHGEKCASDGSLS